MPHNAVFEVEVGAADLNRLRQLLSDGELAHVEKGVERARRLLGPRTVWNVNSTAAGGGVAEMLQPMLAYSRAFEFNARWLVIPGTPSFFDVTKRIHNNLHAAEGDGGPLGDAERNIYNDNLAGSALDIKSRVRAGDIVICHDPQTAGLLPTLAQADITLIWRCHIGYEDRSPVVERAWAFLRPYLQHADALVFSREAYIPDGVDQERCAIIHPSIDPFSAKNQLLDNETVKSILMQTGILAGSATAPPEFMSERGENKVVLRRSEVLRADGELTTDRPLVTQVSRWDYLKDPLGVLQGFASQVGDNGAALVLAGPSIGSVTDDPEGGRVLNELKAAWEDLPSNIRRNVYIACLPMEDREENAAIVNALQRHSTIVVQKSLYEGFGLTVTEAMWKARPVVASAVGGIRDQIDDGQDGRLIADPTDLRGFGRVLVELLDNRAEAERLGAAAQQTVREKFLFIRHLFQYADLFRNLLDR